MVERDGAQCTYVSPDGRRCSERSNLEFDHVGGRALGAKSVVGGELHCREGRTRRRRLRLLGHLKVGAPIAWLSTVFGVLWLSALG